MSVTSPPAMPSHPATDNRDTDGLREIALHIQSWMDWERQKRAGEGLETTADTAFFRLPFNPTFGMFESWHQAITQAADTLAACKCNDER